MWVRFEDSKSGKDVFVRADMVSAVSESDYSALPCALLYTASGHCHAVRCSPADAMQKLDDARAIDAATRECGR